MKAFKVCQNGMVKVTSDGINIDLYFYSEGIEARWIAAGYVQVF